MTSEVFLKLFQITMRLSIVEKIALRSYLYGQMLSGARTPEQSHNSTIKALEDSAVSIEHMYLSDPVFAHLPDAQRALLADEFRELIDDMKSYVDSLKADIDFQLNKQKK
jgi:hypothetical protein